MSLPDDLAEAIDLILASEIGPDPRMSGTTDCYLVCLDDVDNLRAAITRYRLAGEDNRTVQEIQRVAPWSI